MADSPSRWQPTIQIIGIAITTSIAVGAGFWSLADPRNALNDIRHDYLTVREHNEFATRTLKSVDELLQSQNTQDQRLATLKEMQLRDQLREREINDLKRELDQLHGYLKDLHDQIHHHEHDDYEKVIREYEQEKRLRIEQEQQEHKNPAR